MRHFLGLALAPTALTGSVPKPSSTAALVAAPRLEHRLSSARARTGPRAVSLPVVAAAADLDRLTAPSAEEPPEVPKDRPPPSAGRLDDPTATGDTAIAVALVAVVVWRKARAWLPNLQLGPSCLSGGEHSTTLPAPTGTPRNGTTGGLRFRAVPPLRGGGAEDQQITDDRQACRRTEALTARNPRPQIAINREVSATDGFPVTMAEANDLTCPSAAANVTHNGPSHDLSIPAPDATPDP